MNVGEVHFEDEKSVKFRHSFYFLNCRFILIMIVIKQYEVKTNNFLFY